MSLRPKLALAVALLSLAPVSARADKLDKEDKKWLDEVRPIMLPDEERSFRDLKDKADRLEFQKIFWARRDPDLDTPDNEFQAAYNTSRAEADRQFKVGSQAGSATDCGRVYLLLGKPDDMKADKVNTETPTLRPPEVWTYRDRPGQTFTGGEVKIGFERDCQLPQGARLGEQLNRVAESRITQPNIGYKKAADGHLVKLAEQLPKPSPAQALLKAPRQDFPLATQSTMMLRSPDGGTYLAGLVHATGVPHDASAGKTANVGVVVQALDAQGKVAAVRDRQVTGEFADDGSVTASYGVILRPGKYTMNVAVVDPKTGKGSVASAPVEVPDLGTGELKTTPLVLLQGIQEGGATPDPKDPLADFILGTNRLVPSFDNSFQKSGSLSVVGAVYNNASGSTDDVVTMNDYQVVSEGMSLADVQQKIGNPGVEGGRSGATVVHSWTNNDGSGLQLTFQNGKVVSKAQSGLEKHPGREKPSMTWSFSILKDGKPVAKTDDQVVVGNMASPSIGPVPLSNFAPGKYVVQLKVRDNLAKKDYTQDAPFEVK